MEQTTATAVDPKADRIRTFITHQLGAAIARHGDDFSDFDPGEILCFEDIEGEEIYISPWFKLKAGRHRCPVGRVGSGECRGADGGLGMTATDDAPSGGPLEGMALLAEIATDVGRLVKLVADGAGPAEHEALFAAIDPLDTDDVKAYLYAAVLAIATLRHTAEERDRLVHVDHTWAAGTAGERLAEGEALWLAEDGTVEACVPQNRSVGSLPLYVIPDETLRPAPPSPPSVVWKQLSDEWPDEYGVEWVWLWREDNGEMWCDLVRHDASDNPYFGSLGGGPLLRCDDELCASFRWLPAAVPAPPREGAANEFVHESLPPVVTLERPRGLRYCHRCHGTFDAYEDDDGGLYGAPGQVCPRVLDGGPCEAVVPDVWRRGFSTHVSGCPFGVDGWLPPDLVCTCSGEVVGRPMPRPPAPPAAVPPPPAPEPETEA